MAKSTKDKDVVSEATDAVNAMAAGKSKGSSAAVIDETPKRFTITHQDGRTFQTDNANVAYAARGPGVSVIDHHNADRDYDGKNPAKEASAKR